MEMLADYGGFVASGLVGYVLPFLIVLSILVFIHELGHYMVARMCGVRVEVFSIGFGKEICGWNDSAGTRWKISMIPLGGYVKMFGDVDPASAGHTENVTDGEAVRSMTEEERAEAFFTKSVSQRAAIVFAGPAINFLFAIILLAGLYATYGKIVTPPVVTAVEVSGAADRASLQSNDRVITINGKNVESFDDIRRAAILALDTPLELTVARGDDVIVLTATPDRIEEEDRFGFTHERGYLGLYGLNNGIDLSVVTHVNQINLPTDLPSRQAALAPYTGQIVTLRLETPAAPTQESTENEPLKNEVRTIKGMLHAVTQETAPASGDVTYVLSLGAGQTAEEFRNYAPHIALVRAVQETWRISVDSVYAIGQIFMGTRSVQELGGVIRIGALTGDMAERGFVALLIFTALLSVNLGIINLFPIPMLDGGHLVFYAIEAVRGSPLPDNIQEYAFRFGFVILIGLMLFANINDLVQIIL